MPSTGWTRRPVVQYTRAKNGTGCHMPRKPEDVLRMARDKGTRMVDLKFTDLVGTWQHFSVPMPAFDEAIFSEGIGFDGSSIRGFQEINESDMLLFPDPDTAVMDPFTAEPTLSLVC